MNRRMGKRKLTRLILAALMATGGFWGSSAEAADVNVDTDTTISNDQHTTTYKITAPGKTFTIADGGKVQCVWSQLDGQTINLMSGGSAGGGVSNALYGGAKNNTLNLYGTVISGYIMGGTTSGDGEISGNKINIFPGASSASFIYGGYSGNAATVTNNVVTITGGSFTDSTKRIAGGHSTNGTVTNNTVAISGDTTNIAGSVYGGKSNSGTVKDNKVTISGGTVGTGYQNVYGGFSGTNNYENPGTGNASNNTVEITGGTINGTVYGGGAEAGDATGNTVNINGSTAKITGNVMGASTSGNATGNTVNIYAVEDIAGGIYAGMSMGGASSGNVLNILGTINISGWIDGDGTQTVNIASKDNVVDHLINYGGIENMNFYLPSDIKSGDTMLTIKNVDPWEGKTSNLKGVTFGVAALSGVSLAKGDTVNLITNPNGLTTDATLKTADSASLGTAEFLTANNLATDTKYTLGISKSGDNTIIATVENVTEESGGGSGGGTTITAEDRLKSPVETRAAAVTLLNAGADMLASQGFAQAANAVALEAAEQAKNAEPGAAAPAASTFTPFAAFGGSSMRAESGSHVDTKGFGINVGFAKEFPNSQGKLLFGPVVEYGGGKYDSYNNDIHADGNSHYWGVGVMARQVNHDSFYYEGSVRFGRVTSDYGANFPAGRVSYDSASNYWAAHLGLGKVFATGKQDTVDAYLKYFYSHQGGDDTTIHIVGGNDEQASFDSVDSNRIRIGARYTHKINEMNSLYGGLAYQYEFGGEARAHYAGLGEAPSPSVKGSSGMLELGWQVKPNNGPVTIDLGVTGWAGKQRGGSVQLGATWTF